MTAYRFFWIEESQHEDADGTHHARMIVAKPNREGGEVIEVDLTEIGLITIINHAARELARLRGVQL